MNENYQEDNDKDVDVRMMCNVRSAKLYKPQDTNQINLY